MEIKASFDPLNEHLTSWTLSGNPCGGFFAGVGCNEAGQVANISLQEKGLSGELSPAVAGINHLTGLYLHYNSLSGEIPKAISNLTELSYLYLNVNNLSGSIPPEQRRVVCSEGERKKKKLKSREAECARGKMCLCNEIFCWKGYILVAPISGAFPPPSLLFRSPHHRGDDGRASSSSSLLGGGSAYTDDNEEE